jgi:putative oxidoreductase
MLKYLQLDVLPKCPDAAILVLRVALGVQMLTAHGWGKLVSFSEKAAQFPDPLHVGNTTSAALAIAGEVVCSVLLVLGLFTRPAAIGSLITMTVAFLLVHGGKLSGEGNGELAFLYLIGFLAILIAGPGRFSLDATLRGKGSSYRREGQSDVTA